MLRLMPTVLQKYWPPLLALIGVCIIVCVHIAPYGHNITSIFHTDERMHGYHPLPEGFVVLEVPAYDGSQYYQVARNLPQVFDITQWSTLRETPPLSYAYQRILLPVVAWVFALGQEPLLPWTFLFINIASLVLACAVTLKSPKATPLHALAIAFCPSAMVGLHFMLAEPLALLIIALFLVRFSKVQTIDWLNVLLLSLLVLSREVNIIFVGIVLLYCLYKQNWKSSALTLIPIGIFFAWHGTLFAIFGDVPFLTSAGARQLPFSAPLKVLFGLRGYNMYTLSSVALFLGFVLPAFLWSGWKIIKGNRTFPVIALFLFLCLMLTLADYIWGSITSVGRVITPVYPLAVFAFMRNDTLFTRLMTLAILFIGAGAGLALALIKHPFFVV